MNADAADSINFTPATGPIPASAALTFHAFGSSSVQPLRFAIAMMLALISDADELPEPARPIDRTAAITSSRFRIGNDLPLPAKSPSGAASRSGFAMKRSYTCLLYTSDAADDLLC